MIYGDRIRLRAIEQDDLPRFVEWFNDPAVRMYLDLILPMSMADEEDWYQQIRKQPPPERPFAIDILDGETGCMPELRFHPCGQHQPAC